MRRRVLPCAWFVHVLSERLVPRLHPWLFIHVREFSVVHRELPDVLRRC